jgi:hypothetical protein
MNALIDSTCVILATGGIHAERGLEGVDHHILLSAIRIHSTSSIFMREASTKRGGKLRAVTRTVSELVAALTGDSRNSTHFLLVESWSGFEAILLVAAAAAAACPKLNFGTGGNGAGTAGKGGEPRRYVPMTHGGRFGDVSGDFGIVLQGVEILL